MGDVAAGRSNRVLVIAAASVSVAYVVVTVLMARHVTFYWDDYFLLLTLDDRGLVGALSTGINGNWWPLATVGLWLQLAAFGSWYPAYIATNAILVIASAWAGWFALEPLARRRPWLLAAALVVYACSLGLVVNVTVMTMSWPLAAALAFLAAALAVRGRPIWVWGGILTLALLAESGLFAVLAATVATVILATRMAGRGWTKPKRADLVLTGALVALGVAGTVIGYLVATADPIDYYASSGDPAGLVTGSIDPLDLARSVASYVPAWLSAPLLPPMIVRPEPLPWLVVLIGSTLTVAVLIGGAVAVLIGALWRRRSSDDVAPERWGRLAVAAVLVVPVVETALILATARTGSGLAPRYAVLWLLPAATAWAVLLQCRPPARWLRTCAELVSLLLVASAATALVALPWTFRVAYDIDKHRWERSPEQLVQMQRCRDVGAGIADQQVSPGLRDDLLCQFVRFIDHR